MLPEKLNGSPFHNPCKISMDSSSFSALILLSTSPNLLKSCFTTEPSPTPRISLVLTDDLMIQFLLPLPRTASRKRSDHGTKHHFFVFAAMIASAIHGSITCESALGLCKM
jgi:hypothetical protein